jgi:hypothetical protein
MDMFQITATTIHLELPSPLPEDLTPSRLLRQHFKKKTAKGGR